MTPLNVPSFPPITRFHLKPNFYPLARLSSPRQLLPCEPPRSHNGPIVIRRVFYSRILKEGGEKMYRREYSWPRQTRGMSRCRRRLSISRRIEHLESERCSASCTRIRSLHNRLTCDFRRTEWGIYREREEFDRAGDLWKNVGDSAGLVVMMGDND